MAPAILLGSGDDPIDPETPIPYHPAMQAPPLDVLVIGEAIVDFVPLHRGPLREARGFELHSGGAPANVAIGVNRLGGRAGLISVVGQDEFGAFLQGTLQREGVDTRCVHALADVQTALCFITLDAEGERSFLHRGGDPAVRLAAVHVDPALAAAAKVVKFSSGPLRTEGGVAAVRRLVKHATGLIACDPGACPGHWASAETIAGRLAEALNSCHVVKASEVEARDITGETDPEKAARMMVGEGAELAVVTLGRHGAVYARRHDHGAVPAVPVDVVDTTGAGDAFMAALLVRLARDAVRPAELPRDRLEEHLAFACRIAAGAVTARGAIAGLPERSA